MQKGSHVSGLIGASLSEPHTSESNGGFSIIYKRVRSYSYDKLWQLEHLLVQLSLKTVAMRETKIVTCCQSIRMDMCTCRSTQGTEKY